MYYEVCILVWRWIFFKRESVSAMRISVHLSDYQDNILDLGTVIERPFRFDTLRKRSKQVQGQFVPTLNNFLNIIIANTEYPWQC